MPSAPCAIIEARTGSSRLPGKVLLEAEGEPLLVHMIRRVRAAQRLGGVIVATTDQPGDDLLAATAAAAGALVWRGSEQDVMTRVLDAARHFGIDSIVELTGDCPLADPALIDHAIGIWTGGTADYVANILSRSYPAGMDVQIFSTRTLRDASDRTSDPVEREHVSLHIYRHPERYRLANFLAPATLRCPELRLTVDEAADLVLVRALFRALYPASRLFGLKEILDLVQQNRELAAINAHIAQRRVSFPSAALSGGDHRLWPDCRRL